MKTVKHKSNFMRIIAACSSVVVLVGVLIAWGGEGTNGNYQIPYDQMTETLRINNLSNGTTSDSLLVHDANSKYTRRIAPISTILGNYMTTSSANVVIANMQSDINGKVPNSRKLTINGVTQDFSADRSFTVVASPTSFTNNAVKTLNAAGVQISTTKNTRVSYTVTHTIALTLVITSGSSQVFLEISPNNSTWTTISQAGYSDGVAVAVALTKTATNNVQGEVPAGWYVRLRTTASGGGSAVYNWGQEAQY